MNYPFEPCGNRPSGIAELTRLCGQCFCTSPYPNSCAQNAYSGGMPQPIRPVQPCPVQRPPRPCPEPPYPFSVRYALLSQRGTLSGGPATPLSIDEITTSSPCDFSLSNNVLTVMRPGVYLLHAICYAPSNTALDTTLTLQAGAQTLPALTMPLISDATSSSRTYAVQNVLTLVEPTQLAFYTADPISLTAEDANTPMLSLFILQLDTVSCPTPMPPIPSGVGPVNIGNSPCGCGMLR